MMSKSEFFVFLLLFACQNKNPSTTGSSNVSAPTTAPTNVSSNPSSMVNTQVVYSTQYSGTNYQAVNQVNANVSASQQASQQFLTSVNQAVNTASSTQSRIDEFFVCKNRLSHAYMTTNTIASSTSTDPTADLAKKFKSTLVAITNDIRSNLASATTNPNSLTQYAQYSAVRDANGLLFVFYTSNASQDVFYSYLDPSSGKWYQPKSLTNTKSFMGVPTASLDASSNKVVVSILDWANNSLVTYTQLTGFNFQKGTSSPSSLSAFNQLQGTNGAAAEKNQNIVQNSVVPNEATGIGARIMQDIFTIGTAEIARVFAQPAESASAAAFSDLTTLVCPP